MPELPEVQTVVNSLIPNLINKKIILFKKKWKKVLYSNNYKQLKETLSNQLIHKISRNGKYIVIQLDNNYLVFHLRMTGYLYHSKTLKNNKYIRCYFLLNDNTFIIYEDIRKFGGFYYLKNLHLIHEKLGVDPLSHKFTLEWFMSNLIQKNRQIKGLLLDQGFICGLGNIYIDEILWKSKIHPRTKASLLKKSKIKYLFTNILFILNESIEYHGTTIFNFKFDNMKTGNYKNKLNVYGRDNLNCKDCNQKIIKLRIASRGTYICSSCQ